MQDKFIISYSDRLLRVIKSQIEIWSHAYESLELSDIPFYAFYCSEHPRVKHWNILLPKSCRIEINRTLLMHIRDSYKKKGIEPFYQLPKGNLEFGIQNSYLFKRIHTHISPNKLKNSLSDRIELQSVEPAHFGEIVSTVLEETSMFGHEFGKKMEKISRVLGKTQFFSIKGGKNNQVIGCITIFCSNLSEKTYWIKNLGIHPKFRRKGYAKKALIEAEKHIPDGSEVFVLLDSPKETKILFQNLGYSHLGNTTLCSTEEILSTIL